MTALADLKKADVPTLAYGNFITILINFIILAFIIFMMVKAMNKMKKAEPPAATATDTRRCYVAAGNSRLAETLSRLVPTKTAQLGRFLLHSSSLVIDFDSV